MMLAKKKLLSELFIALCCLATAGVILVDTITRRAARPQNFRLLARHFIKKGILANLEIIVIVIVLIVLFILLFKYSKSDQRDRFLIYSRAAGVFLVIWLIYLSSSYFVTLVWETPRKTVYFPQLAGAFLEGKTYLTDPGSARDLTSYEEKWYVAFPPLPALLMLPQVAITQDVESVNTVQFTIFFGALNAALAYAILASLTRNGLTSLSHAGNLWLTLLLAFGSVHWYMSLVGHVWYLSQIVTVTFAALAVFLVLETRSLAFASFSLAIGMLARPTIVLLWLLLYALYLELNSLAIKDWRLSIKPVLLSAIPIGFAISGLLWYNFIRFDTPFDFGYQTMNVGEYLKPDLAQYGQFNAHFILNNLKTIFIALPLWNPSCGFPAPDGNGMSIFITTPALIFLYRARRKSLWVWGAWLSVLLLILPLLFYFNNGSFQFGFRFLMDLIIPLLALLAFGAGERLSVPMRLFILVGVLVNYYGVLWFFIDLCKVS